MERICGNCRLFDPKSKRCNIVVLCEGKRYKIPVDAGDYCFLKKIILIQKNKNVLLKKLKKLNFGLKMPMVKKLMAMELLRLNIQKDFSVIKSKPSDQLN